MDETNTNLALVVVIISNRDGAGYNFKGESKSYGDSKDKANTLPWEHCEVFMKKVVWVLKQG